MSRHFIDRRYGHGAGRVPLSPPARRVCVEARSIADGLQAAARDGESPAAAIRKVVLRGAPAFLAITFFLTMGLASLLRIPPDATDLTIVPFEEPPVEVVIEEPLEEIPLPEPEIEPEPVPEIAEVAEPEPPPVAPPPPEPVRERIVRKPPPPVRERIQPIAAPPIAQPQIALAAPPLETPAPPRLTPARAPAPAFAAARPPDVRPRLDAPVPRRAPQPTQPQTTARPRLTPAPAAARPAPTLALAAPAPTAPRPRPTKRQDTRRPAALPSPPRRVAKRSTGVTLPTSRAEPKPPTPRAKPSRTPRIAPAAQAPTRAEGTGSLPGVSLGSLDACLSNRMEDALKQKLVASVRDRIQCESPTGRYHFVETKNVNAFLMRIERGKGRKRGDRCAELTYALDCLARSSGRRGN